MVVIRAATPQDIAPLERLLRAQHAASKYANRTKIHDKALTGLLMGAYAQQHQRGPQGAHLSIAERDGKVVGFIIGVLDRVYHIGEKLTANDLFFVNEGTVGDTLGLVDAYIAWARGNPKVIEVVLSWSDTLPGAEKVAGLFRRKGFTKSGEMYEMRLDAPARSDAA